MAGSYLTAEEKAKIGSANGAELTLLLYEHAVKVADLGEKAAVSGDTEEISGCADQMIKVTDLLLSSLDTKYPVTKDFERMYSYLKGRLEEIEDNNAAEVFDEVGKHFSSIKENWEKVMKAA